MCWRAWLARRQESGVSEEDGEGGHRFRLLESVRDFALEQVTGSQDGDAVGRAHARYFLELSERPRRSSSGAARGMVSAASSGSMETCELPSDGCGAKARTTWHCGWHWPWATSGRFVATSERVNRRWRMPWHACQMPIAGCEPKCSIAWVAFSSGREKRSAQRL